MNKHSIYFIPLFAQYWSKKHLAMNGHPQKQKIQVVFILKIDYAICGRRLTVCASIQTPLFLIPPPIRLIPYRLYWMMMSYSYCLPVSDSKAFLQYNRNNISSFSRASHPAEPGLPVSEKGHPEFPIGFGKTSIELLPAYAIIICVSTRHINVEGGVQPCVITMNG